MSASTEETRALIADLDPFSPSFSAPPTSSPGRASATSLVANPSTSPPESHSAATSSPRLPATYTTLGANVKPNARLELISDDEEEDDDNSTNPRSSHFTAVPASPPPKIRERVVQKAANQSGENAEGVGSGTGGFLGGMFRGGSGQGTSAAGLIVGSEGLADTHRGKDTASTEQEYNEKASSSSPSTSSPAPPRDIATSISNPLASISSIFRSARSSPAPSPSHPSTLKKPRSLSTDSIEAKGKLREKDAETESLAEIPFDFNKFLEQMRTRSAEPIAKYLRSQVTYPWSSLKVADVSLRRFLKEFSRRPPISSAEQIRIINDFLDFIAGKMRLFDPWKASLLEHDTERGEAEFDMALEAMEKLVMNRLWHLSAPFTGI